ncbi:hypothetical protein RSOL_052170 [Rhizoctonia solani AG-3 Rhs1AP]|uniref:Uncharacterized protein n=1 Tax=Rhizoctonia solani AG-3 Rhs1AP TaxID=1086054 RepID=X8IXS9_9AGAM|nr:hypothetical protein RSOL_052170 [Rhizoctonia solani AG-3 Rhs1AP]
MIPTIISLSNRSTALRRNSARSSTPTSSEGLSRSTDLCSALYAGMYASLRCGVTVLAAV